MESIEERLEKCYSGIIYDVLNKMGISNTVLPYDIKSINPNQKIAGKVYAIRALRHVPQGMSKQ